MKTLEDRFDALRDELELALAPTAPGISDPRRATGRLVLVAGLLVLFGAGFTALARSSSRLAPAVSTSNWFEERTHSMEPTLGQFDKVQVDYDFTTLARSDLVVARVPTEVSSAPMVLRVIGLPGESVLVGEDLSVEINGIRLQERYVKVPADPTSSMADAFRITLGPDQYYLAGDNRDTPTVSVFVTAKRADVLARAEHGCSLFMDPEVTPQQLVAARTVFQTAPAVKSFRYVDSAESLEEIKRLFSGTPIDDLKAVSVPTSFRAVMNSAVDRSEFEETAKSLPGVSILRCGMPIVDRHYEQSAAGPIATAVDGVLPTSVPATTGPPSTVSEQPG